MLFKHTHTHHQYIFELWLSKNAADGAVTSLTVLLWYLLCAILPPSGRCRKKRWFHWKTLLHESLSDEDYEGEKYTNFDAVEVQTDHLQRCVPFSSSAVSDSQALCVWKTVFTTLLALICMFYTKAYTVICEAIRSRKGIVNNMEHFYTETFCFVIHF